MLVQRLNGNGLEMCKNIGDSLRYSPTSYENMGNNWVLCNFNDRVEQQALKE